MIIVLIPILPEDALNIKKRTAFAQRLAEKNAKSAKEEKDNHLVQVYRELV